ncbi:MAG: trigger factor [Myxococcota bacterium]
MSESEPKIPAFSVTASETGPVARSLAVEVEAGDVTKAFDQAYKAVGRGARIKGFRPGKAPRSVLERMYGPSVREDVERQLVSQTFVAAVEREGIVPVVEPQIEAEPPEAGKAFRYTAQVEVKPTVTLPELEGLPAQRPEVAVADDEVEGEVESLRQRRAPLEDELEDAVAAQGTIVTLDYAGTIDGEPFEGGSAEGAQVELGSGRLVPGFEEGLEGARRGESREVRVTFPDDYPAEELRGKAAVFATQVKGLQRRVVPALDDAFAKSIGEEGIETLDQLRAKIREAMEKRQEQSAAEAVHRSLVDALIERAPFEVPGGLVERRLSQRLSSAHQQLESVLPHEELHARLGEWRETWREEAERDVRESLLLEAVAEQEKLEVADAELSEKIEEMARDQGIAPKRLEQLYAERGLTDGLRARLRDEKALEFLTSRAKVEAISGT